ncbi:MAG: hypothetical protein LAO21_20965 [Acidobacteriia bacterium]|nr:hypothetical protein [Terriglobia bacterium]
MKNDRGEVLEGAPLRYAPENELGVVFLFAHLAKRWRLRVDEIHPGFPDCIAYQKTNGKEKRVRIEFEYKSRNFKTQRHPAKKCDCIVCWEHNWPEAPKHLQVIELRKAFGLGFNVWIVPVDSHFKEDLERQPTWGSWSVPSQAHKDDLILFYLTRPDMYIKYIGRLLGDARKVQAHYKDGKDYQAPIRRVCILSDQIYLEDLRKHKRLRTAGFVRGQMQGRPNATAHWKDLFDMMVSRNSAQRRVLARYAPEKLS